MNSDDVREPLVMTCPAVWRREVSTLFGAVRLRAVRTVPLHCSCSLGELEPYTGRGGADQNWYMCRAVLLRAVLLRAVRAAFIAVRAL